MCVIIGIIASPVVIVHDGIIIPIFVSMITIIQIIPNITIATVRTIITTTTIFIITTIKTITIAAWAVIANMITRNH